MRVSQERMNEIGGFYTRMQNHWASTGSGGYSVRSSGPVAGSPIEYIKTLRFTIGAGPHFMDVHVDELVAMVGVIEQMNSAQRMAELKRRAGINVTSVDVNVKLNFAPSDEEILRTLSRLPIEEEPPGGLQ